MTGETEPSIQYLDKADYERLYQALAAWSSTHDEPLPPGYHAKDADIDALVDIPKRHFFGYVAYPTLAEKAAIIFYTINKRQIFLNGNKRMSTLSLLVFLDLNGKAIAVSDDELTQKALWLANTESLDFHAVKSELVRWLNHHLKDQTASQ